MGKFADLSHDEKVFAVIVLCVLIPLVVALGLGLWFLITFGIAWLAVTVAASFGYTWPFWGTFGGVMLVQIVSGMFASRK